MVSPKVSVIWVNYNGMKIRKILLESLDAIDALDYENFELIVVDNGSTDGSSQLVADHLEKMQCERRLIRLNRNLGFTGGNNVAYRARSPESKYMLLVNSDAVPFPGSLRELVERTDSDASIGAAQGIILDYNTNLVDTAGEMVDELLGVHSLHAGSKPDSVRCPIKITYASGAFCLYRVDAIRNTQGDRLFDDLFAYYDDNLLGLKMWNRGFRSVSLPFPAARHRRGSSFRRYREATIYLSIRNYLYLNEITNSRYRKLNRLFPIKWAIKHLGMNPLKATSVLLKAGKDCRVMLSKISEKGWVDLYRAPIVRIDPALVPIRIFLPGRFTAKPVERGLVEAIKSTLIIS